MNLSDFFSKRDIIRDGEFARTMPVKTSEPGSICYAVRSLHLGLLLANPNVSAIITTRELAANVDETRGLVVMDDPRLAYYQMHNFLVEHAGLAVHTEHAIHPSAHIASSAIVGEHVIIGEGVVVDHRAMIGDYTVIGQDTYIGPNVVTGVKGMQDTRINGRSFPLLFAGGSRIGARCELLTNAIVERPYHPFYTEIGDDCQISVKTSVGHGNRIGRGTMVAGGCQLAGDVTIGENVFIGPSVTVAPAVTIGDRAQIKLGSIVVEDVKPGQHVAGNFAVDLIRQLRFHGRLKNGQL